MQSCCWITAEVQFIRLNKTSKPIYAQNIASNWLRYEHIVSTKHQAYSLWKDLGLWHWLIHSIIWWCSSPDCSPGVLSYEGARVGSHCASCIGVTVTARAREQMDRVCVRQRRGCKRFFFFFLQRLTRLSWRVGRRVWSRAWRYDRSAKMVLSEERCTASSWSRYTLSLLLLYIFLQAFFYTVLYIMRTTWRACMCMGEDQGPGRAHWRGKSWPTHLYGIYVYASVSEMSTDHSIHREIAP